MAKEWVRGPDGTMMPPRQKKYLDWLLTPKDFRVPRFAEAYAQENEVHPRTLRKWKTSDSFVKQWEAGVREKHETPDRVDGVMEMLHDMCLQGSEKACIEYLKMVGSYTPTQRLEVATPSQPLAAVPDAELDQLIEATEVSGELGPTGS